MESPMQFSHDMTTTYESHQSMDKHDGNSNHSTPKENITDEEIDKTME